MTTTRKHDNFSTAPIKTNVQDEREMFKNVTASIPHLSRVKACRLYWSLNAIRTYDPNTATKSFDVVRWIEKIPGRDVWYHVGLNYDPSLEVHSVSDEDAYNVAIAILEALDALNSQGAIRTVKVH
jgi:hypothetical protein